MNGGEGMKVGYIWVSKHEQHEALQMDALKQAGCEELFVDKSARSNAERKGLGEALLFVRPGDTMVVWKLDCLSSSLNHLIKTLNMLKERGVDFISLTEKIDTTMPDGQWTFHLIGLLAEFDRDLSRSRTDPGLAVARARGRNGGRPKKLLTPDKVILAQHMYADKSLSIQEICSALGISRTTLYRYVGKTGEKDASKR
jgi:DNA invertase Pin-like site-specific DNA recombinase